MEQDMRTFILIILLGALSGCAMPSSSRCSEGYYRGSYLLGQQVRHTYFAGTASECD
jgi:hypothetical protein